MLEDSERELQERFPTFSDARWVLLENVSSLIGNFDPSICFKNQKEIHTRNPMTIRLAENILEKLRTVDIQINLALAILFSI